MRSRNKFYLEIVQIKFFIDYQRKDNQSDIALSFYFYLI